MRSIILFAVLVCCGVVVSADDPALKAPLKLTCTQVNYTYFDGTNQWSSMGKYWMDSQWGDNRSFFTYFYHDPLTFLRITYGAPFGSISENIVVKPSDQICTNQQGNGVGSIYTNFVQFGKYVGTETVNGIECYKWFATVKNYAVNGQYFLWTVVDQQTGFHMPVRSVSYETSTSLPPVVSDLQMDFLNPCSLQTPPDGTFTMPTYCPVLNLPIAASPRVIWKPPPPPAGPSSNPPVYSPPPNVPYVSQPPRVFWKPPPPPSQK